MKYEFIRQSDATIRDLCYLFRVVHQREVPESYFQKKYDTEWTGRRYIGYIAYDEAGNPAASYAVLPCFLIVGKQKILVAQAVDATTHPDHRQQGLFVSTAQKTHDLARANGIRFVYSFPNDNSYHGFTKRLHFQHIEDTVLFCTSTFSLPLVKAANKFKWFRGLYSIWLQSLMILFEEKEPIPNSVIENNWAGIEHDDSYFRHKSYERNFRARVGNFSLWLKPGDGVILGDISRFAPNDFCKFQKKMKFICFLLGAHQYQIAASPGSFIVQTFKTRHPPLKGYYVCGLDLGISETIPLNRIKFVSGDSDTF